MSRWDKQYSEFQTVWKQVKGIGARLTTTELMEAEQIAEIARLKRVIEYVDGVQEAGAKDLMPLDVINSAIDASNSIFSHITNYNSNSNISHLHNANSHLDRILSFICPFVTSSKESAQAAGQAFSVYRKVIEESTEESKTSVARIKEWHKDIAEKHEDIITKNNEIVEAHNLILVDDEEGDSIQTDINESYNKIIAFYKNLLQDVVDKENEENNKTSIKTKIDEATTFILGNLKTVTKETEALKVFHGVVFGTETEDGEKEGGLKQAIETHQKDLDEYEDKQKAKIEMLLSGATSVGLARAFRSLRKTSSRAVKNYTTLFYVSLGFLFIIASIAVIPELCYVFPEIFETCKASTNAPWISWVRGVLAKSLFVVPALWFAIFASKRRSEHQRLQQEYAHKEAVSKSFEGYKEQIKALKLDDEKLLAELLGIAIKAIGYNASITLGAKHGDDPPVTEALKSVGLGKK